MKKLVSIQSNKVFYKDHNREKKIFYTSSLPA